jgi:hypothetical protein
MVAGHAKLAQALRALAGRCLYGFWLLSAKIIPQKTALRPLVADKGACQRWDK